MNRYTTRQDAAAAVLAGAVIILTAVLLLVAMSYAGYRADVQTACGGVVARLDLSEWVQVCKP